MYIQSKAKRSIRSLAAYLLAIFIVLTSIVPAIAAPKDVYSSTTSKTFNYCTYKFYSHIRFDGTCLLTSGVAVFPTKVIPAGNLSAQINLYKSNGNLVTATDWLVSTTDTPRAGTEFVTIDVAEVGSYYCSGKLRIVDGTVTLNYDTGKTDTMRISQSDFQSIPVVEINSRGEIYGSEPFLKAHGIEADLIRAENSEGVVGYVRAIELYAETGSTQSVNNAESANRIIPMYESDGETIVGYFEMSKATMITPTV